MHIDALPFLLLAPSPFMRPIHLLLPTPSDQSGPAARGYQSPSCVGPVKWKMAATERAHFREPSSFEGAWWPLTATVLTWSPDEHSTAIIVFTKARGEKRGSRGDPVGWCLNPGVAGCLSEPRYGGIVGKHDMGSLTARWKLWFNMSVELLANKSLGVCVSWWCVFVSVSCFLTLVQRHYSFTCLRQIWQVTSVLHLWFLQLLWHKVLGVRL